MHDTSDKKNMDWKRLNAAFDEVYALAPEARAVAAESACGDDKDLLDELKSMIAATDLAENNGFLGANAFVCSKDIVESQELALPERIGNYSIESELGRGGMGIVYLAENPELRRKVALKVIKRGMDSDEILRRFRLERHLLATLDHPNIARLLDGGTTEDGRPYFVLEYVDGHPITEFCDSNKLDIEQRLKIFQKVCSAVSFAHRHLVVHRDIKPSNIIVDSKGEPKLLDFGISKLLDPMAAGESLATTLAGVRLMTPEYASPEQAQGGTVSTASDLYSLGVLLYELLSGRRPVNLEGKPLMDLSRLILETDPPAPSTVISESNTFEGVENTKDPVSPDTVAENRNERPERLRRKLRGDLDNIVMMALRKEPSERYSSVEQFSDDISNHLSGLPVRARPASFNYLAAKFIGRYKPQVMAAGAALCAILMVSGAAIWQAKVATDERNRANERFEEVRKISNLLVSGWDEGLGESDVSHDARARLASISAQFLDSLSYETSEPELLKELAEAHLKLGHEFAYQLIDTANAAENLSKSEMIARRLVSVAPNEVTYKDLLVRVLYKKDEFFGHTDLESSIANRKERLLLREEIYASSPVDEALFRGLGQANADLANGYLETGDSETANEYFRRSIAAYRQRLDQLMKLPVSAERDEKIASSYAMISHHSVLRVGDLAVALEAAESGYLAGKNAYSMAPERSSSSSVYIMAGVTLGQVLQRLGDNARSEKVFSEIATLSKTVNDKKPSAYVARKEYDAYLELAEFSNLRGDRQRALEFVRLSDRARQKWLDGDSHRDRSRNIFGSAFHSIVSGKLLISMGELAMGRERLVSATQLLMKVSEREPMNNLRTTQHLASLLLTLSDVEAGLGVCDQKQRPFGGVAEQTAYCQPDHDVRRGALRASAASKDYLQRAERILSKLESSKLLRTSDANNLAIARERIYGTEPVLAARK